MHLWFGRGMFVYHGDTVMDKLDRILACNKGLANAFSFTYLDSADISSEAYRQFLWLKHKAKESCGR